MVNVYKDYSLVELMGLRTESELRVQLISTEIQLRYTEQALQTVRDDAENVRSQFRSLEQRLEEARAFEVSVYVEKFPLNDDEKRLVRERKIIDAIKALRTRYNCGLKEGKRVVDAYKATLCDPEKEQ